MRVAAVCLVMLAVAAADARASTPSLYVNLGDSYAIGYQPGRATGGTGGATIDGYADQTVALARERGIALRLRNFGCGGASSRTLLEHRGCRDAERAVAPAPRYERPQAAAAARFLRAHRGEVALVTVTIGRNDLRRCLTAGSVACARRAAPALRANLRTLLARLRRAAGATVPIVGATYPNVDLAAWADGTATGRRHARRAQTIFGDVLNPLLRRRYEAVGGTFVDVTRATGGDEPLPAPVERVCALTWYCGFDDIHANRAGHAITAGLIAATL